MNKLSKVVSRQDANFKKSPSSSNETSVNLSTEISSLLSDESGAVTFKLYKEDFLKALGSISVLLPLYYKKATVPAKLLDIYDDLANQVRSQFGDSSASTYSVSHLKREDGRYYLNGLKIANGFNLRSFLIERHSQIDFIKDNNGALSLRLQTSLEPLEVPIEDENQEPIITPPLSEPLQLIYYGAPGTGKSFTIDGMADEENSVRTTFHPDSDYASFVGAYKPTMELVPMSYVSEGKAKFAGKTDGHDGCERKIVYKYVPQAFLKAYVGAWADLGKPYFLIIEEINRGNCAQIFGDLFQLLDRNNSGASSYAIHADEDIRKFLSEDTGGFKGLGEEQREAIANFTLTKDNGTTVALGQDLLDGKKLLLPPNLYIWATMNTSDQSLFPIDSAFKRRWNWKYMPIEYAPLDKHTGTPINWTFEAAGRRYSWGDFLRLINPEIYTLTESSDKQMGYFFAKPDKHDPADAPVCVPTGTADVGTHPGGSAVPNVISQDVFVNKVLFYLWTDVFKDYEVGGEKFHNEKANRPFRFTDFFEDPDALGKFIENLKLQPNE